MDPGFAQYVERHGIVSSIPETLMAYKRWKMDAISDMLDEEYRRAEFEKQLAESKAKGKAEGIAEGKAEVKAKYIMDTTLKILKLSAHNQSPIEAYKILKILDIPDDVIEAAKEQLSNEKDNTS